MVLWEFTWFLKHLNIGLQLLMIIIMIVSWLSYINSWSCYENPQDSSYTGISHLLQPAQAEVVLGQLSTYLASWVADFQCVCMQNIYMYVYLNRCSQSNHAAVLYSGKKTHRWTGAVSQITLLFHIAVKKLSAEQVQSVKSRCCFIKR